MLEALEKYKKPLRVIIFGSHTPAGRNFDLILLVVILLSIALVMLESVAEVSNRYHDLIFIAEWIITGLFTIEYLLRIWITERPKTYILSFYGLIDFFAILPTYLELAFTGATAFGVLRAVRLLRVFRVLKLVQYIGEAKVLLYSIKSSLNKITVFLSYVIITATLIGTVMYMIEGPESGFTSIPRSIYWAVVTLTTVGYGDISPQTPLGQFLAMLLMVIGYGVIAVPTGLVTADLVKSGRKPFEEKDNRACNNCNNSVLLDAQFCHHCGAKLL